MQTVQQRPWTSDELGRLPDAWRYEIDRGELVIMPPPGLGHGRSVAAVTEVLRAFVRRRDLRIVVAGEVGFGLEGDPETLRGADAAFISHERLARIPDLRTFSDVPPDLAVEVHDPGEPSLARKIQQYLAAGGRAVWVVDPSARTLTRQSPEGPPRIWADPRAVFEEPVLPGFSCRLGALLGE